MQTDSGKNELTYFNSYIYALTQNLNQKLIPENINVIVDGGAFNGAYAIGTLLYLKQLEKQKLTTINKVSGTSIGAILSFLFITDSLFENINWFETILNDFRSTSNLKKTHEIIKNLVNENIDDVKVLNDKLFITYYDTNQMQQIVTNKYNSKEELIDILTRSSFIPYLIDGNPFYKDIYSDGITPHIFNQDNTNTSIFINLMSFKIIKDSMCTKNEKNIWSRLMIGVVDANNFFTNKKSDLISSINEWKSYDFLFLRGREILYVLFLFTIKYYISLHYIIPISLSNNKYLLRIIDIIKLLLKDILSFVIL
tara:strand:+ start:1225 stop:2157 length:933 start_codon:yes stop_codon:yes gene_type:complete